MTGTEALALVPYFLAIKVTINYIHHSQANMGCENGLEEYQHLKDAVATAMHLPTSGR